MIRLNQNFRTEFRINWLILLIATSSLLLSATATSFALPFVYPEVIAEFGWRRDEAMLIASTKYGTGFFAALIVGRWIDSFGVWRMLIATCVASGIAMISAIWINDLVTWSLAGVLMGFATPGGIVAANYLVLRGFNASQGTALALVLVGASMGSIIIPPVISLLIAEIGWRWGFAALSLGIWGIVIPLIFIGMRWDARTGATRVTSDPDDAPTRISDQARPPLSRTFKQRNFWLVAAAILFVSVADSAFTQHQVLILQDYDFSVVAIATIMSAIGIASIPSRLAVGALLDMLSNRALCLFYLSLGIASILAFWLAAPLVIALFVVLRAIGHSAVLLDTIIAKHIYGLKNLGSLVGIFTALSSLGFAVGPWAMGRMHDDTGSYSLAFIIFAILPFVATGLIWLVRPHYWLAQRDAEGSRTDHADAGERHLTAPPLPSAK